MATLLVSQPDALHRDGRAPGRVVPEPVAASAVSSSIGDLIESYRLHGYRVADLDPLGLAAVPELSELRTGASVTTPDVHAQYGIATDNTVIDLLERTLRGIYCDAIGLDCTGVRDATRRAWLFARMESTSAADLALDARHALLEQLIRAEMWERVAGEHVEHAKRFSLEGCESLIPLMISLVEHASRRGVDRLFVGMPHRGRLNVLVNLMGMPAKEVLARLDQATPLAARANDLPYHLGATTTRSTPHGDVTLTLSHNPSHLESATPVVSGMARAYNDAHPDRPGAAIIVHGDAAFAGQGVVMETLNMTRKNGYDHGGTIHIVVNNQIGFTTPNAANAVDAVYCTDAGRMVDAPVIHVNADRPEAVLRAAAVAFDYRMVFGSDVIIDLVGYRRLGHSEHDVPSLTQPYLHSVIASHPTVTELYHSALGERIDLDAMRAEAAQKLLEEDESHVRVGVEVGIEAGIEPGIKAMDASRMAALASALTRVPPHMRLHKKIEVQLDAWRSAASDRHAGADWCFAENLALASLLADGVDVRISGMDVGRGTFMHRHAVWHSQHGVTGVPDTYLPLKHISAKQGRFDVFNSPLTEEAVLGFEYGYSVEAQDGLTIWEAQYGDFVNGAQVFIDQYIASGESKWGYRSRLVVALPHGHEGVGPEHSNAYLSRFLQLCAEGNMQVVMPSTSAQWFHLLRRQASAVEPKPLIVMSPKSQLYGNVASHSPTSSLVDGHFHEVLGDATIEDVTAVRRVILCAGKFFYDLDLARREPECESDCKSVAIVRIEQLYPFPAAHLGAELARFPNLEEVVWAQEEDANQGAWRSIRVELESIVAGRYALTDVCRESTASGAHSSVTAHLREQSRLVGRAFA